MTKFTKKEILIDQGFVVYDWLTKRLDNLQISRERRTLLSVSCFDQVIEHHLATCTLLRSKIYGSAFALVRPIFEGFVRGVWLSRCATEIEINQFEKDTFNPKFGHLLAKVEQVAGFESGLLTSLKKSSWSAMNSYTHTGILQASKRFTKEQVQPSYSDEEVTEVLKIAGSFALLSFQQIASAADRLDLAHEGGILLAKTVEEFSPAEKFQ